MAMNKTTFANTMWNWLIAEYPDTDPSYEARFKEFYEIMAQSLIDMIIQADLSVNLNSFELVTATGLIAGPTPVTQVPAVPNVTVSSNLTANITG